MQKKKDTKVFLGIGIAALIVILSIFGFKNFGNTVSVPQVDNDNIAGSADINAIPIVKDKLQTKEEINNKMQPIQVIKKDNGLVVEIFTEGTGSPVKTGDTVAVDYRGFLTDGTIFDESYKRGTPFDFTVGAGSVIPGWEEGVLGMKIGEKRRLTIPADLAYGKGGYPGVIPPNATLIFEMELKKIGQ